MTLYQFIFYWFLDHIIFFILPTHSLATSRAEGADRLSRTQLLSNAAAWRSSFELRQLARLMSRGRSGQTVQRGQVRSALSLARVASTVIGQAQPDPKRHPLLVPFTPERLRHTWAAVIISLWAWLIASLVFLVSIPELAISFF